MVVWVLIAGEDLVLGSCAYLLGPRQIEGEAHAKRSHHKPNIWGASGPGLRRRADILRDQEFTGALHTEKITCCPKHR